MRFQLALEDISVDVDNLIEMLIILKYATITQIGRDRLTPQLLELTVFGAILLAPSVTAPTSRKWGD